MPAGAGQADESAPATRAAGPGLSLAGLASWHHELTGAVEEWAWLRTLNDRLTAVLGPWRERHQGNPALELMHGGRWLGHPLHPALSDLPIGLWAGALLLDLTRRGDASAGAASRDGASAWASAGAPGRGLDPAVLFSAAGLAAAVATAATGVVDWTVSDEEDRRLGLFHGVLNTAAVALQGGSLAARLAGHRRAARGLGAASLAVTGAAAYLGGHLVFARAVMVSRVAGADGPRRWVRVIQESELRDDVPAGVLADGRRVLLCRHGGTLYALDDLCSHAAGLLSRGTVDGLTVTCPLHGSRFCLADGSVRRGPSHQPQPVIRSRVRNGWIEVRGNQPAPRRPVNGRK